MKLRGMIVAAVVLVLITGGGSAQTVPDTPEQVARPGSQLLGNPKIALVEVADGFKDLRDSGVRVSDIGDEKLHKPLTRLRAGVVYDSRKSPETDSGQFLSLVGGDVCGHDHVVELRQQPEVTEGIRDWGDLLRRTRDNAFEAVAVPCSE